MGTHRIRRRILDVDGCSLSLLGLEPAPQRAPLDIVTFGTRAVKALKVLDGGLAANVSGRLDALPFDDEVFDAVAIAGTIEHVVADDDALDELVRVLRPGGLLFIRVPQDDRLAWFDAQNLYTYIAGTSNRGEPLAGRPALRFRRHYGRDELLCELERRQMRPRIVTTEGWGPGEGLSLAVLLTCRWMLRSPAGERRARTLIAPLLRAERRLRAGTFGRDVVIVAERVPSGATPVSGA